MILTYKFYLLPSKHQHRVLAEICESQRQLYNAALQERIDCYQKTGNRISCFDQFKSLTLCRRDRPEMAQISVRVQRWTLERLDEAIKGFFRRIKAKNGKVGFPRFRGKGRWRSFGFSEFDLRLDGKRIRFKGMPGGLKVHFHRPLPDNANIRSCVFRRDGQDWTVSLQVLVEAPKKNIVKTMVGVDLGLNVFAYCSDGVTISNPRIARRFEREMRCRQRALARCKRGSKRRLKVKAKLAQTCRKVKDTRLSWLHQKSAELVSRANLIVVEDLNVKGMLKNHNVARSISDASWSKFLSMLEYKAEKAGAYFIRVNPRNTSQKCSGCGELVPKILAVRVHSCPHCGLNIDRDYNASINILRAGLSAECLTWPSGASVHSETQTSQEACMSS